MPWLSILMALLAFFASKSSGASNTKALVTAGLAGAGTYYVTHETDWGKANLGSLDGVVATDATSTELTTVGGATIPDTNGTTVKVGSSGTSTTSPMDVLKSWGATGTAAVVGTTALATTGQLNLKNPWVVGGLVVVAYLILK